jgi:hypothetical protein
VDLSVTALSARAEIDGGDGRSLVKFARISLDNEGKITKVLISR